MQGRLELWRAAPELTPPANRLAVEVAGGVEQYGALRNNIDNFNTAFHLRQQGYLDEETWRAVQSVIRATWENPQVRQVWDQLMGRPDRFYPEFREYVDSLPAEGLDAKEGE